MATTNKTESTEQTRSWTKAGSIYTFLVKDHGKVAFDRSKASAKLLEYLLDYGIGRIFPDRTSVLKGSEKLEGMRKLIALAESGSETLSIRETPEEKAAREAATAKDDLFEALGRLGYDSAKATTMLANFGRKNKWGEAQSVLGLSAQDEVAKMLLTIKQERAMERAGPAPKIDLSELLKEMAE